MTRLHNADAPRPDTVYARKSARALLISLSIFSVCWWGFCWCTDANYHALEHWAQTVRDEGIPGVLSWVTTSLLVFPLAICSTAILHCRSNWNRTRWWVAGAVMSAGVLLGSMLLQTWFSGWTETGPMLFPPDAGRYAIAALVVLSSLFFSLGYWHVDRLWRRRRDNKCLTCGYDLRGSPGGRCPECGDCQPVTENERGLGRE